MSLPLTPMNPKNLVTKFPNPSPKPAETCNKPWVGKILYKLYTFLGGNLVTKFFGVLERGFQAPKTGQNREKRGKKGQKHSTSNPGFWDCLKYSGISNMHTFMRYEWLKKQFFRISSLEEVCYCNTVIRGGKLYYSYKERGVGWVGLAGCRPLESGIRPPEPGIPPPVPLPNPLLQDALDPQEPPDPHGRADRGAWGHGALGMTKDSVTGEYCNAE